MLIHWYYRTEGYERNKWWAKRAERHAGWAGYQWRAADRSPSRAGVAPIDKAGLRERGTPVDSRVRRRPHAAEHPSNPYLNLYLNHTFIAQPRSSLDPRAPGTSAAKPHNAHPVLKHTHLHVERRPHVGLLQLLPRTLLIHTLS